MIAALSPADINYEETLSTLRYNNYTHTLSILLYLVVILVVRNVCLQRCMGKKSVQDIQIEIDITLIDVTKVNCTFKQIFRRENLVILL